MLQNLLNLVDNNLKQILQNQIVAGVLSLFLILYGSVAAPQLPHVFTQYLKNPIVSVLIMFLILVNARYNVSLSLMMAIGFILTMQTLSGQELSVLGLDLSKFTQHKLGNQLKKMVNSVTNKKQMTATPNSPAPSFNKPVSVESLTRLESPNPNLDDSNYSESSNSSDTTQEGQWQPEGFDGIDVGASLNNL